MRLVELSDYPGVLLRDIHRQRRAHRWWTWFRGIFGGWRLRRGAAQQPVLVTRVIYPADQEGSIAAGIAGEQRVADELGEVLGNEWVLFHGYRNRRGEIDHLLLGPRGLFAIEVKHHNATVYIRGDDWQFEKFDRWGNRVGQGRIEDRTGRSPSIQLNEPADELEKFLRSRRQPVSIARIVILNHPRSRIGSRRNPTVRVTTSSRDILNLVRKSPPALSQGRLTQLAHLIEQDHRFHQARRPRP